MSFRDEGVDIWSSELTDAALFFHKYHSLADVSRELPSDECFIKSPPWRRNINSLQNGAVLNIGKRNPVVYLDCRRSLLSLSVFKQRGDDLVVWTPAWWTNSKPVRRTNFVRDFSCYRAPYSTSCLTDHCQTRLLQVTALSIITKLQGTLSFSSQVAEQNNEL